MLSNTVLLSWSLSLLTVAYLAYMRQKQHLYHEAVLSAAADAAQASVSQAAMHVTATLTT